MTYKAKDFIQAIEGSGGIVTTIASRVGCTWVTAKKYIDTHPTVAQAYQDECAKQIDRAEGVVLKNIDLALQKQKKGKTADAGDAKWYLRMKGKERGYTERQEITGPDAGPVKVKVIKGVSTEEL